VFSKSIDDASSIGGGGGVVAQNPFDISADRGFPVQSDAQIHRQLMYDLPFGENRRFAQKGVWSHALSNWQWSGDFTVASGLYFTPSVLGGSVDIARGVSGSQRANLVPGQSISLPNPTAREWFNTAAFCTPESTAPTERLALRRCHTQLHRGPGTVTLDMTINRTIPLKESRSLDLR